MSVLALSAPDGPQETLRAIHADSQVFVSTWPLQPDHRPTRLVPDAKMRPLNWC
jgi:hypothetical protein